ncbi:MAG: flagellar motor protein MotB [Candidatus Gastranaerophilaceae bacterium]
MLKSRHFQNNDAQENIFWITMTDLLLGLAVIFIVLFVLAMTGFAQAKLQEQHLKSEVAQDLAEELKAKNIDVQVDLMTGDVKLSDLQLFEVGSYQLSNDGKAFLNKFIPIYLSAVFDNPKISDKIVNIVIQGHTDSQSFANIQSKDLQFVRNMELSTNRANEVAKYIFFTPYNKTYSSKLHKMLIVEGKSYSDPVLVNGKEDYAKSRRVELKLVVKSSNLQDFMGIGTSNESGK